MKKEIIEYLKKKIKAIQKETIGYFKMSGYETFKEEDPTVTAWEDIDPGDDRENRIWEDGYFRGYAKAIEDAENMK